MKLYNISTKREYEVNGQKKTIWMIVGTMRETDDGKKFINMNMWPDQSFYVFDQKPREYTSQPAAAKPAQATPDIQIDNDDIPF